jgi:DNA repair exonuclease SbcCD ATPase subunit/DNA repair exonuclease SbcCD nuclease subunit
MLTSKKKLLEKCQELGLTVAKNLSKEKLTELINQKQKVKVLTIDNPNEKRVKTIYHIADIHIRYLERHVEYKEIFNKLYGSITEPENSVMVISGDVFHNRDRFVGETIVLFDDFIKTISSKMEIFAIVGNHDCFNHADRIDSISGINTIAKYENFHLLKESGIYNFANLTFGVSSLLDGGNVPTCPENLKANIALYHGIVSGSILDNGTNTQDGIPISTFKGYDMVLLGDVHRRQYLNKDKTIAYPGSLIQQNFKEEMVHGFLKWDVETCSSEFVPIQNDYSFVDIPVNSSLDLNSINFSKHSRIRLVLDQITTEEDIEKCIEECSKYTNVLSMKKILKDPTLNKNENEEDKDNTIQTNRNELEIIKSLSPEKLQDDILKLHSDILGKIEIEEVFSKSLPWSISKIEFKNIFSYGNDYLNVIDLKKGVTGILANNASGKTNILNTIMYGLFGTTRVQNHLNKNIVSRYAKKEDLFVKLTVEVQDGSVYYIERTAKTKTRSRIKSSEEGQLDLVENLKFYTDEKILNLSTKTETEKHLRDTLSIISREEFILTNMMSNLSYGANMSIISMSGSQLDDVFNKIFNLGKYRDLHQEAKKLAKNLSDEIKKSKAKLEFVTDSIKDFDRGTLHEKMETLEYSLEKKTEEHKNLTTELEVVDEKLLKLKNNDFKYDEVTLKRELQACNESLEECIEDIQDLLNREDKIMVEYETLKSNYTKALTLHPKPKNKIKKTSEEMTEEIAFLEGKRKTVDFDADITNEYLRAKKYINSISSTSTLDINKISNILTGLQIDKKGKFYILPVEIHKEIINDFEKKYVDPALVLKYKQIIEDKESRDLIVSQNIEIDQKINVLKRDIKNKKIQDAYDTKDRLIILSSYLEFIDAYNDKLDIQIKLKSLGENKEIETLLESKHEIVDKISEKMDIIRNNELDLQETKSKIDRLDKLTGQKYDMVPKLEELTHLFEIYKTYIDITHQKNLPKILISSVIKNIVTDANTLIYNTTGLLCDIQENEKWEIVIKKDNITIGPDHCSGYERMMLNIALKISFDKYKQLSSTNLFMIDETIDCVSESNFDQIDTLLEYLKNHYKSVLLISHNEDLKKKIDNRIGIKLWKNCSSIA